ncbi:MAG TPA: hypothetical protein VF042_05150 [Gemmatimonadaceae bacterium]
MTTCAECLTSLATARVADIVPGSAIAAHCATCERCASVATEMRLAEHRLAITLAELRPRAPSATVVEEAIVGAERERRRTAARWLRGALGVFAFLIAGTWIKENIIDGRNMTGMITEVVRLRCISPQEAVSLATPYLRERKPAVYTTGDHAITMRGAPPDVTAAIAQIDSYQATQCPLPSASQAPLAPTR